MGGHAARLGGEERLIQGFGGGNLKENETTWGTRA